MRTTFAAHSDPERAAEERALVYCQQRSRRPASMLARPRVFVKGSRLGIWEAVTAGFWECETCNHPVLGVARPAVCERCQAARVSFGFVWHGPEIGEASR